jgi:hypothetical protein
VTFLIILVKCSGCKSKSKAPTFLAHSDVGQSGSILTGLASGFPCKSTQFPTLRVQIFSLTYFACENVFVRAISVRETQTCIFNIFNVDAVLAAPQVVRLSLFPHDIIQDASHGRSRASAPAPRASAISLGARSPVVVVACPVLALGD